MKKLIIHLIGTECSGKSTLIKEIESDLICGWDIFDWYIENNIIVDGDFIFDNFAAKRHQIWNDFRRFAANHKDKIIYIIESSGSNKEINYNLNLVDKVDVITIMLQAPSDNIIIQRAGNKQDITIEKCLEMKQLWNKISKPEVELSFEEAYFYIKELEKYYLIK